MRLRLLFSPLLVCLLMSGVTLQTDGQINQTYYYANGQQIPLVTTTRSAASIVATPNAAERIGQQMPGSEVITLHGQSIALLPLQQASARSALRQTLSNQNAIRWTTPVFAAPNGIEVIPTDEIIVRYASGTPAAQIDQINAAYGLTRLRALQKNNTWVARVGTGGDALKAANALYESGQVIYAEPNFVQSFQITAAPDDTFYPQQWYLNNTGQINGSIVDADIDAPEAWDIETGSSGVIIAVLDDGVDMTHPDLDSKIITPFDAFADDPDAAPMPKPWDSHGTAVAGILAAETGNGAGVAGICQGCQIMPIRIFYRPTSSSASRYGTPEGAAAGIAHAWQNGAAILNNSWGSAPSSLITDAFNEAMTQGRGGLGSVIIASSGNIYDYPIIYPASLPGVVAVGATNLCDAIKRELNDACNNGQFWWGTSHGAGLDLSAPGTAITTTDNVGTTGSDPGDYYNDFGGTSAAAPVVSGVMGLILSQNPALSLAHATQRLLAGTDDINAASMPGYDTELGWGRVNAYKAVTEDMPYLNASLGNYSGADGIPTFEWSTQSWPEKYQIAVTDSSGSAVFNLWVEAGAVCTPHPGTCTVTPAGIDPVYVLENGDYRWTVRGWSDANGYGVHAPGAFTLDAPPPALPQFAATPVTGKDTFRPAFHFTAPDGSAWFNLVVADSSGIVWNGWISRIDACGSLAATSCDLARTTVDLADDSVYDVYLRAWGPGGMTVGTGTPGGYSGWQGPVGFIIDVPGAALPANLTITLDNTDPTFSWDDDLNATWFQLVIKDNTSGTALLDQWYDKTGAALNCDGATCAVTPQTVLIDRAYSWQVRAWGPGGFSTGGNDGFAQGPALDFSALPAPTAPDVSGFVTYNAETHTDLDQLNYQWGDVANASWFRLSVADSGGFVVLDRWFRHMDICGAGLCTVGPDGGVDPQLILTNGDYVWKVLAWGPGGMSAWSATATFTMDGAPQTAAPDMTGSAPTAIISTNNPTFSWTAPSGVTWYEIWIGTADGTEYLRMWFPADDLGCDNNPGSTCAADPPITGGLALPDGAYIWYLRAYGPAGLSLWTSGQSFTVSVPPPGGPAVLISPPDGAGITSTPVTFTWQATTNTSWYRHRIYDTYMVLVAEQWMPASNAGCADGGTCFYTPTLDLTPDTYHWAVAVYGQGSVDPTYQESADLTFTLLAGG